jgi:hypothetical protein
VSSLGDAKSSLGDTKSSLGDAEISLGDAKSSLGDADSSLGDAKSSLGDAKSSLGDATVFQNKLTGVVTWTHPLEEQFRSMYHYHKAALAHAAAPAAGVAPSSLVRTLSTNCRIGSTADES